jgi:hypothetical protein
MEAVARQFATDKKVLVIRNGWFSFRWTQIFDMGRIPPKASSSRHASRQRRAGAVRPGADRRSRRRHPRTQAGRRLRTARRNSPA